MVVSTTTLARLFTATEGWFSFGRRRCLDVVLTRYAFDFSVWEIFGALLYGGRLVIVPQLTSAGHRTNFSSC